MFSKGMELLKEQKFIVGMSRDDFKKKYIGSYLGIAWAFIQPLISLLIFWFIFQIGFKQQPINQFPFILWFSVALIPWNFFADALQSSTNSILENSFLVKKVRFKVGILPIVKIYSSLFVHCFFLIFLFLLFSLYGYYPNIYFIQIPYFVLCLMLFTLGLSWITSSVIIFLKDVGQIVAMILQFGFWLTPIFYSITVIPEKYQFLIKLNPMYYIIEGYRGVFLYQYWFWERPQLTVYFWFITVLLLIFGFYLFRKLRPHFADVL